MTIGRYRYQRTIYLPNYPSI